MSRAAVSLGQQGIELGEAAARCSSLLRMLGFMAMQRPRPRRRRAPPQQLVVGMQAVDAGNQLASSPRSALGLVERCGGRMHQLVGEAVRQRLQHVLPDRRPAAAASAHARPRGDACARRHRAARGWSAPSRAPPSSAGKRRTPMRDDRLGLDHRRLARFHALTRRSGRGRRACRERRRRAAPTSASMSRGTARSTITIGRWRRAFSARSTMPRPMIGSGLAVQETTMSYSASRSLTSSRRMASPLKRSARAWPRSSVRLATVRRFGLLAGEVRGAQFDHLAGTDEQHLLVRQCSRRCAPTGAPAAAAIETMLAPMAVVERTSFATAKVRWNSLCSSVPSVPASSATRAACFIWPRICGSPSTIESRPAGDAEHVAHGILLRMGVEVGLDVLRRQPMVFGQPIAAAASAPRRRSTARCGCRLTGSPPRAPAGHATGRAAPAGSRIGSNATCSRMASGAVW